MITGCGSNFDRSRLTRGPLITAQHVPRRGVAIDMKSLHLTLEDVS